MKQLFLLAVTTVLLGMPAVIARPTITPAMDPPALHYLGGEGAQILVTYTNGELHLYNSSSQTVTYRIDWKDASGQIVYSDGKTVAAYSTIDFYPLTDSFNVGITGEARLSMYEIY